MVEVDLDRRLLELGGDAEAPVAVPAQLGPQVAHRREQPRAELALAARARLELARLLERVDPHLRVAADRERHARLRVGHRRQVAVAEVALGRRAGDDRRSRCARARRRPQPTTWIPWITLARGPRNPVRSSSSIGEQPCSARHSSSSRRCSWAWTWRTIPWRSEYSAIASSHDAGTARTLCAAIPTSTPGTDDAHERSASTRRQERLDVADRRSGAGPAPAAGPRRPSRRGYRPPGAARSAGRPRPPASATACAIAFGSAYGRAVGLVVDVVELADDRVAGRGHLGVRLERDRVHRSGSSVSASANISVRHVQKSSSPPAGPGPLGAPAQPALERMRVRVRHPGNRATIAGPIVMTRASSDASARSTTRAATAASASSTSSAGEWLTPVSLRTSSIAAGNALGEHAGVVAGEAHDLGHGVADDLLARARQRAAERRRELAGVAPRGHGELDLDPGPRRQTRRELIHAGTPRVDRARTRRARARRSTAAPRRRSSSARSAWPGSARS